MIRPEIHFHGMKHSDALAALVEEKVDKLAERYDRLLGCRVGVEAPPKGHHHGHFEIRITLAVPGNELVVSQRTGSDPTHEDPHVALRDAFDAAERMLEHHAEKNSGAERRRRGNDHQNP